MELVTGHKHHLDIDGNIYNTSGPSKRLRIQAEPERHHDSDDSDAEDSVEEAESEISDTDESVDGPRPDDSASEERAAVSNPGYFVTEQLVEVAIPENSLTDVPVAVSNPDYLAPEALVETTLSRTLAKDESVNNTQSANETPVALTESHAMNPTIPAYPHEEPQRSLRSTTVAQRPDPQAPTATRAPRPHRVTKPIKPGYVSQTHWPIRGILAHNFRAGKRNLLEYLVDWHDHPHGSTFPPDWRWARDVTAQSKREYWDQRTKETGETLRDVQLQ